MKESSIYRRPKHFPSRNQPNMKEIYVFLLGKEEIIMVNALTFKKKQNPNKVRKLG